MNPQLLSTHEIASEATTLSPDAPRSWQEELSALVRDPAELLEILELPSSLLSEAQAADQLFELRVPRPYLSRIEKGNLEDPLLKQVLPLGAEVRLTEGYSTDPLAEQVSNPHRGLVHKYHGRVLLVVAPSCAINCRYCFRRHFPYAENNPSRREWQDTFDYIKADPTINEVIYSGGDPLASSDRQLQWLTEQLIAIPHIKRLRVHSRLPVVIPQRITDDTLKWLAHPQLQSVLVLHINHANEIDDQVRASIKKLRGAGVTLLNQSVLLKGVNDSAQTLAQLSEALFAEGVLPYYLHLLDKVQGAAHFDLPEERGIALHRELQGVLPGFLVPKLTREEPGADSKTLIL